MSLIGRSQLFGVIVMILAGTGVAPAAPLALVRDQGSQFVIYYGEDAPSSVAMAASELQGYLHEVSGAKLAIVHEPRVPMICLGENAASRAAGLPAEDIPIEGFRLVTQSGNLYILGPDTADGERTPGGGTSSGTRNCCAGWRRSKPRCARTPRSSSPPTPSWST